MKMVMLVDGYNVIHKFPCLKNLLKRSVYQAQAKLISLVSNYCSAEKMEGYLIFDAYRRPSSDIEEEMSPELKVVLTGKGKTADSYIEKFIFQRKFFYDYIYVVTSDYSQRMTVADKKVLFISPENFLEKLKTCQKDLAGKYSSTFPESHPKLSDYLEEEVRKKLEDMRR
ncbi:MAG: NYN domain-containing protein [Candidatus Aerophobetes bacterium]|nr:NYN domain-containing protein [Candidatus Aerophobetes bacterium]